MALHMPRGQMLRCMDSKEIGEWVAFSNIRRDGQQQQPGGQQQPVKKQSPQEMIDAMKGIMDHQKRAVKWKNKKR